MARKKKSEEGGPTGNEWLGTYADMVTLLMTLFVILYSMSSADEEKIRALSQAFSVIIGKSADSILEYDKFDGSEAVLGGESKVDGSEDVNNTESQIYEKINDYIKENNLQSTIDIGKDDRGIVLQIRDSILFESGKSELINENIGILDTVNDIISTIDNSIIIEGHTDNIPINTSEYKDNWDLSSKRATNVLRYFTGTKGQDPTRFSIAGYGEYKPKVDNSTDENRTQNRRVNIIIVSNNEE